MGILIGPIIGVAVILVLIQLVSLPFWLLKNSVLGAIMLYLFNFFGVFAIKITFIHCLIVGVFGVPGIIGLIIYLNFLK
ncbi:MAG: pro-sigmaK processing inhibitor BofA family protein [Selenomonadaceae bacterium]|nr:pro-sigmaK processing inhibitor BofA family protein [Selenomonadaceae bacterium]